MRLIDADKLMDSLYETEFSNWVDKGAVADVINDEEEVDAVPIKFIIDYLNKGGEDKISTCLQEWEKQDV